MQKRMNTEAVLAKLAEIRRSVPYLRNTPRPETKSLIDARTVEEFEIAAVAEALESLADDIDTTIQEITDQTYEKCLDVYYAAEELAREPEHAHLIAHVEAMRAAHQQSYGRKIPTKEETERRRGRAVPRVRAERLQLVHDDGYSTL